MEEARGSKRDTVAGAHTTMKEHETNGERGTASPGKYLTFRLAYESYGIPVLKIREIIRLQTITSVPELPEYIKGVINLRGRIIPVVDLRVRFCQADIQDTESTCIVVVQAVRADGQGCTMGLMVDGVEEVVNLTEEEIEPTPDFGGVGHSGYLMGMAKIKGRVKTLLNIDEALSGDALVSLGQDRESREAMAVNAE